MSRNESFLDANPEFSLAQWERRKAYVGFTAADAQLLAEFHPHASAFANEILDEIYGRILNFEETRRFFADEVVLKRIQSRLHRYILMLTEGEYGEAYLRNRIQVGLTHHRIGVAPRWYMGTYARYTVLVSPKIRLVYAADPERGDRVLAALHKLIALDNELAISVYFEERERAISQSNQHLAEARDGRLDDARRQTSAIDEASRVLAAMAEGDLTVEMEGAYDGALGRLKDELVRTSDRLRTTVLQIREAALSVARAAREIHAASHDLSRRTEMQAASLERTAATTEELTATVRQNADNAAHAAGRAATARASAEKGSLVAQRTVEAMSAIRASGHRVGDIIVTVDEIAFHTNILALNAAVEAARAGDQGRGFAVVASEIRALAKRSAAAAKEIKALIRAGSVHLDEGTMAVGESDAVLHEIAAAGMLVGDLVVEIAAASREQSAGIIQVSRALAGLEEVTQQNAAMVEQSVASADALEAQARNLRALVEFFNVGDGRGGVRHAANPRQRSGAVRGEDRRGERT